MSSAQSAPESPPPTTAAQRARAALRRAFVPPPDPPGRETTPEERKRAFQILFFSLVCLGSGQSLMFAILPSLARDLGLSEFMVGAVFSVSAAIWVFTSPYWGRRSDHIGRKPVILIGLCGFGISTVLFASVIWMGLEGLLPLLALYPLMVATRSIYGIFGAGSFPAAQAYVVDRTDRSERVSAVSTIGAAFGLGTTLGPGVASALVVFGLLAPFYVIAVVAFVSAFAIWRFLPERTPPSARAEEPAPVTLSWRDPRVLPFLVVATVVATVGAVPIQTGAFLFRDALGLDADQTIQFAGVGLMASSMAALFAQLVLVQRFHMSAEMLMRVGSGVAIAAFVVFAVARDFGPLVFAMLLSGLGFGLARPGFNAAASLAVRPSEQGTVAGLMGATGGAGFIFAPLVAGGLYQLSPYAPYVTGAVTMTGVLIYVLRARRFRLGTSPAMPDDAPPDRPGG